MRTRLRASTTIAVCACVTFGAAFGPLAPGLAQAVEKEKAAVGAKSPLSVIEETILAMRAHTSNAGVKLRHGVMGMRAGEQPREGTAFSAKDCCTPNIETLQVLVDTVLREVGSLQRDYERARNTDALGRLGKLSELAQEFEKGIAAFAGAPDKATAQAAIHGLGLILGQMDTTRGELQNPPPAK